MESREETLEQVYKLAFKYEAERGSCPQCVLAAIMETLDIIDEKTIKAVDAMAGGTGLSTEGTCGALVGGLLAISLFVGRSYADFSKGERKRRVFQYAKKLCDKFKEEYGSIICKDVHKKLFGRTFNMLDPKDYALFEKAGAHVDKCPEVSGKTAKWATEIILEDLLKEKEIKV